MHPRHWLGSCVLIALLVQTATEPAHAQFDPSGRKKKRRTTTRSAAPGPAKKPASKPAPPRATNNEPAGSNETLIRRYTGVVLSQPGSEFPLRRLAELARERDGNLEPLLAEFEKRANAPGAGQYAALTALAGLYEQAGRIDDAIATYARAIESQPSGTVAPLARARLLERRGDLKGARDGFEQVLPRLKGSELEITLRSLMRLSLDLKDFDTAKKHHEALVKKARGSLYVRAELGRELLTRGENERAVAEYRKVVEASRGDNRALAPALRDLGAALIATGQAREAIGVLRQGLRAAAGQSGISREIDELLVQAYRLEGRLPELLAELEKRGGTSFDRLVLLGKLYEETGNVEKALDVYRKALRLDRRAIETRLKVVQLLELSGELDEAIAQYEELVRAAPDDSSLTFRFVEALLQRGERARALRHLDQLERRVLGDEDALVALIDFYERIGETDRARKVLERLSATGVRDPRHLVELGSRYWRDGKRDAARATWKKILVVPNRSRGLQLLGEVYLDHDLSTEALEALRKAVELAPGETQHRRSLAVALERVGAASTGASQRTYYDEALKAWEKLLEMALTPGATRGSHLAREARSHIVKAWRRTDQLQSRMVPLARRLNGSPPDLEAGRLLAEAQLELRDHAAAERTLRKIVTKEPGDIASLLSLERVLVAQKKLDEAIGILERLVKREPRRAREYYQRMARYAAEQYQDERAIRYAERAVELSPDDAHGHQKLGEMYRRRQETDRAIAAFRKAIAKNDRLYPAYFQLAELLIGKGEDEEADRWLRRVVRSAPDEELVSRAARLSLQINLSRGSIEILEADLLPLALGQPDRPLYRRLLVEVYGTEAFPLVHRLQSGDASERQAAEEALKRLGERAVKPLLDALSDERREQQRTAVQLLGYVPTRGAGPALLSYAAGDAPTPLRTQAVLAAAATRDPRLLPKLEELIFDDGRPRDDVVARAAAWAVAEMGSPRAAPLLRRTTETQVPSLRALAALGLGRLALAGEVPSRPIHERLEEIALGTDVGPLPRAAAAFALGELASAGRLVNPKAAQNSLVALLDAPDPLVQSHGMLALARLGSASVDRAIAEALTGPDESVRRAACRAAVVRAGERVAESALERMDQARLDANVDVALLLERLLPTSGSVDGRARALIALTEPLAEASVLAVRTSSDRAIVVSQALLGRSPEPGFSPLTDALDQAAPDLRVRAEEAASVIAQRLTSAYLSLVGHNSSEVRAAAIGVLGLNQRDPQARDAVLDALKDPHPAVQSAAFEAVENSPHAESTTLLTTLIQSEPDWRLRRRAVVALGRALARGHGDRVTALSALRNASRTDPLRLVRDEALKTLAALAPPGSAEVAPAEDGR